MAHLRSPLDRDSDHVVRGQCEDRQRVPFPIYLATGSAGFKRGTGRSKRWKFQRTATDTKGPLGARMGHAIVNWWLQFYHRMFSCK